MLSNTRQLSFFDHLIDTLDQGLRILTKVDMPSSRLSPATGIADNNLSASERKLSSGLIRIDHTGEVCAQALYLGQALVAKEEKTRRHLLQAAAEENDHLVWCAQRLRELDSRPSYLNLLWFNTSLLLGIMAGLSGDRWSLGFIVATEQQVEAHLDDHLQRLPAADQRSAKILLQMRSDEIEHADNAKAAGGAELPNPVKSLMALVSKIMTTSTYWI